MRQTTVPDPAQWDEMDETMIPQTSWRRDLMKGMTYTQFWQLVKERQIDKARRVSRPRRRPAAPAPLAALADA